MYSYRTWEHHLMLETLCPYRMGSSSMDSNLIKQFFILNQVTILLGPRLFSFINIIWLLLFFEAFFFFIVCCRGYLQAKDFKRWLENNYKLQDSGPFTIAGGDWRVLHSPNFLQQLGCSCWPILLSLSNG